MAECTLLEQLDAAEGALRRHLEITPPIHLRSTHSFVDPEHIARTNALSALCAAAAARCLVSVEEMPDAV